MTGDLFSLVHGESRVTIAPLGAEARAWTVGGVELLWPSDPAIWNQTSPILYPVVGWTRDGARVDGKHYALGLHGFAAKHEFLVETRAADFVRLSLRDDTATRAIYPFAFRLVVEYRLNAKTLEIAIEVENPGDEPVPYACGLHPGFNWPFAGDAREGAIVRFEKDEWPEVPVIAPGGLISEAIRPIPLRGREIALSDALFAADALCFLNPASRSLRFEQSGGTAIKMDFNGFDHVALWTRPGAPFLCLEPWTGYSDPEGFTGDLFAKPSMRVLQAGERARHGATFEFCSTS